MSNESDNKVENINVVWLNNSFLEKAIRSSEEDETLQVTSYEVTPATAAGDNYASEMYRVSVHYARGGQQKTKSLIVKSIPAKEELVKLMAEIQMFPKENMALSSVLPNMCRLLEEASPSTFHHFSPRYYHNEFSPDVIVMEDLKEIGFKMAKRSLGLDMKHSMLVMRKIARFHASSAVLNEKNPEIVQPFYESVFADKSRDNIESLFGRSMKNVADEVENWPDYRLRFATNLQDIADNTSDLLIQLMQRDDNEFNVFKHGDLWLNNMMFLYSDGTGDVEDVRFVDYQLCHFGSPAIDLHYFLHTSVSTDLIDEHPKLLNEYHKTLKETLILLGYEHLSPTVEQFQKQLENKSTYAIIVCCTVLPIVLADPNYIPDMEKVMVNGNSIHFSDAFKEALKKYLPEFERRGWL